METARRPAHAYARISCRVRNVKVLERVTQQR